ncbi:MAG TPA: hypothetical protein VFQ61_06290 [Polyangiaceae bacterium]|nr:hypothetical protein [Polyangiaceae bacterium]
MGRLAEVIAFERAVDEGAHVEQVKVDPGGDAITSADHVAAAGDDAPPLPGDYAQLVDSVGAGGEAAVGYNDPRNPGKAKPGEKRIYARSSDGAEVAEIWLKGSGSITVENGAGSWTLADDGTVTINGVTIDPSGNITAPGEVTAKSSVKLSTHMHPTAMGPSGAPTPG